MSKFQTHDRPYHDFAALLDTAVYQPLPDEWFVGITDVVDSTSAVTAGRYKDVNFAGASAIAALGNAWDSFDFPFVFRGDGAAFALHPSRLETATSALRQTVQYIRKVFQLDLRAGLVSAVGRPAPFSPRPAAARRRHWRKAKAIIVMSACRCRPGQERPSKWSRPSSSLSCW